MRSTAISRPVQRLLSLVGAKRPAPESRYERVVQGCVGSGSVRASRGCRRRHRSGRRGSSGAPGAGLASDRALRDVRGAPPASLTDQRSGRGLPARCATARRGFRRRRRPPGAPGERHARRRVGRRPVARRPRSSPCVAAKRRSAAVSSSASHRGSKRPKPAACGSATPFSCSIVTRPPDPTPSWRSPTCRSPHASARCR